MLKNRQTSDKKGLPHRAKEAGAHCLPGFKGYCVVPVERTGNKNKKGYCRGFQTFELLVVRVQASSRRKRKMGVAADAQVTPVDDDVKV